MHPSNERVVRAAAEAGLGIEVEGFPEGTRTAQDAAAAIGCPVGAIVKTLVLDSDRGPVVVLASGENRLDFSKVAAALGVGEVRRADAEGAREATGYPIGGTAPFGHPRRLPMVFDRDLLAHRTVWASAGTPQTVFAADPQELAKAAGAEVAEVAQEDP
jgi:Cys-tRNA(Pro) deacylase